MNRHNKTKTRQRCLRRLALTAVLFRAAGLWRPAALNAAWALSLGAQLSSAHPSRQSSRMQAAMSSSHGQFEVIFCWEAADTCGWSVDGR